MTISRIYLPDALPTPSPLLVYDEISLRSPQLLTPRQKPTVPVRPVAKYRPLLILPMQNLTGIDIVESFAPTINYTTYANARLSGSPHGLAAVNFRAQYASSKWQYFDGAPRTYIFVGTHTAGNDDKMWAFARWRGFDFDNTWRPYNWTTNFSSATAGYTHGDWFSMVCCCHPTDYSSGGISMAHEKGTYSQAQTAALGTVADLYVCCEQGGTDNWSSQNTFYFFAMLDGIRSPQARMQLAMDPYQVVEPA